ncbi:Arm DNA-binding domain-containing protein [Parabacteroides johnsonii]
MSTTVNVVCYKSKVLKNNESPLMIRVCKDRKLIGRGAASTKG